ncbi:hypothetical protein [Pseudolysinimonas yzui]|uniref:Aspartate carbamoyltransferase n=1 Tax=Pseudolysinimonas yzui TaxID=2708254 RepID=A0A8J3GQ86_9MICO|nr:hypothetical protein [Pseudolysinimonas yzui]GHF14735.1 aspartate carbamoyltransferase [Pseudolysinimonas yzui]
MARRIHAVADLSDAEIDAVLDRARALARKEVSPRALRASIGLVFLEPSLRTRVGFEAAAYAVGATPILIQERRTSERSVPERLEDTLRTVSGYVDALIVRSGRPSAELAVATRDDRGWLNGGDSRDHPSQALIDLFAIEMLQGPVDRTRIAIVGDLRMRSVTSLLELLERHPPAALSLVTSAGLTDGVVLPPQLATLCRFVDARELDDIDVVYAAGVPDGAIPDEARPALRVGREVLAALRPDGVALSPMPVIDEIASSVRDDPRVRYFEQSDLGLFVRIALLELLLA